MSAFSVFLRSIFKVMPSLFFIVLGVALLLWQAGHTAFTTAVVIACTTVHVRNGNACVPTIQFETPQKQTITTQFFQGQYTVGQTVNIRYDPHNPISVDEANGFSPTAAVFVSLGCIGLGVLSIIIPIMKYGILSLFTFYGKPTLPEPHTPDAQDPSGRRRKAHHHPHRYN